MTVPDTAARELDRELIGLDSTPATAPYSAAAALGDLVWTSGVLPVAGDGSVPEDFQEQVRVALANLRNVLVASGADWSTVLKINGYVTDIERLPELNAVYEEVVCAAGKPARTTVEVTRFRGKVQIELEAVAYRRNRPTSAD